MRLVPLRDFVPARVFDAHAHLWDAADMDRYIRWQRLLHPGCEELRLNVVPMPGSGRERSVEFMAHHLERYPGHVGEVFVLPGDTVEAMGELRNDPRTMNVEKINVTGVAELIVKTSNPVCPVCGRNMKSIGKDQGYRCRECRTKSDAAVFEKQTRWVVPGWYEPPESARRHLSKPLKRMGIAQPVDFVNSRTV